MSKEKKKTEIHPGYSSRGVVEVVGMSVGYWGRGRLVRIAIRLIVDVFR